MSVLRLTAEQFAALKKKREPKAAAPTGEKVDRHPLMLRDQMVEAGLPEPYREHVFHPSRNWRIDLAFPDRKLAIEVDGGVHRIKGRFLSDIEKSNALTLLGWRLIRVTPRMVETKEALHVVRQALQLEKIDKQNLSKESY